MSTDSINSTEGASSTGNAGSTNSTDSTDRAPADPTDRFPEAPSDPDSVWTASSLEHEPQPHHKRGHIRRSTLTWGLILAALGGLLVAFGAGLHIDLVTTGIVLLAGTGVLVLVVALLPHSRGRSTRP
ncbi:MAG: hypothetical protein DI576_11570 [Actinomyces sp.]|nr:MAG: hypothetical protein DI576_11570 [Actinomyces sp.]